VDEGVADGVGEGLPGTALVAGVGVATTPPAGLEPGVGVGAGVSADPTPGRPAGTSDGSVWGRCLSALHGPASVGLRRGIVKGCRDCVPG